MSSFATPPRATRTMEPNAPRKDSPLPKRMLPERIRSTRGTARRLDFSDAPLTPPVRRHSATTPPGAPRRSSSSFRHDVPDLAIPVFPRHLDFSSIGEVDMEEVVRKLKDLQPPPLPVYTNINYLLEPLVALANDLDVYSVPPSTPKD
jgi:hypothetical protein